MSQLYDWDDRNLTPLFNQLSVILWQSVIIYSGWKSEYWEWENTSDKLLGKLSHKAI